MNTQFSPKRRQDILAVCCLSLFLVSVDSSIVNVALPKISIELHAEMADLQWIVDGYPLVLASLLIFGGSLGDRFGRKPVFIIGMTLFGVGSLLCSFARNPAQLVAARVFQAFGGAMLNPVAMAIIVNTFSDSIERAKAIGVWGAVNGLGAAAGPLLSGILVSTIGWRSIFWINVPAVLLGVFLTWRFVPNSKAAIVRRFDLPGQILTLVFMACAIGSIIEGPRRGGDSRLTIALITISVVSFFAWIICEWRAEQPLIDPRFFRNHNLSAAIAAAILAFASIGSFLFVNTLYLQTVRGLSPFAAGVMMLPVALISMLLSPLSGKVVGKYGPAIPLIAAGLAFAASAVMIFLLPVHAPLVGFVCAYFLFGSGVGLVNAPITNSAVSSLPASQAGVAAGMASTARQIGMSLGVAIAGAVIANRMAGDLATGLHTAALPLWILVAGWGGGISTLGLLSRKRVQSPNAV